MNPRRLVVPVLVAGIAIAIWQLTAKAPVGAGVPACTWRIGAGTAFRQARPFDELPAESPLRLSFWCDEPRFVYVFAQSAEDGTVLLWPSPLVSSDLSQPLPAGTSVLPGTMGGKELAWTSRSGIRAVTTYVVVAARQQVAELEALLPRVRQWSNTVFPDLSMVVTKPKIATEIVAPPGSTALPSPLLLRAAARSTDSRPNGPLHPDSDVPGVWLACWTVVERKA